MTSWRMELTVLTDLSASIFAACFMVLLIFIGLARPEAPPSAVPSSLVAPIVAPIVAETALRLVERRPLGSAAMVEMLYRHAEAEAGPGSTPGIDVFADRIEVRSPGSGSVTVLSGDGIERRLGVLFETGHGPVRLYVFSHALYGRTLQALEAAGVRSTEISVPGGLRNPLDATGGWSPAFLRLGADGLDEAGFRRRLAVLLDGSAGPSAQSAARREPSLPSGGAAAAETTGGMPTPIDDFWNEKLAEFARRIAFLFPLVGAGVAAFIWTRRSDIRMIVAEAAVVAAPSGQQPSSNPTLQE